MCIQKQLLLVIIVLFSTMVQAQELTVKSMTAVPMDLSASQYERMDLVGQACGLVKVQLAATGGQFEGNVIGQVEYKTGEYWVYMSEGTYMLTVKHPNFVPLDINFKDYGISGVSAKTTYKLTLLLPESREKSMQQFTLRYSPNDAIVIIDSKPYQGNDGIITVSLPVGQYDYLVTASGYDPINGSIQLKASTPSTLRIDLEKTKDSTPINIVQHSGKDDTAPINDNIETIMVNGVSFNMVRVEGGTFTMGATPEQESDADSDEKPAHQVTLSTYSIGETEVTQALWVAVMGSNPSKFKGNNRPVEMVTWYDCQTFIQRLNQLTGRRFRLPTEAEWEYAARGGNKNYGLKYSGSNYIDEVAWYTETTNNTGPKDVKTKKDNELGLYDMSGNVYEWCQDMYGDYSSSLQTNPSGPSSGSFRVYRGGCGNSDAVICRVSNRYGNSPALRFSSLGLRLAL